jgi:hypothetical protein
MQRIIVWCSLAGVGGCLLEPTFVAITPDYGYVDGCTDVMLSGHHLGTEATASIDGVDLPIVPAEEDPTLPEQGQDVGFEYYGTTSPSTSGAGFKDVTLTVDGQEMTLPQGFYYRACPLTFQVDTTYVVNAAGEVDSTSTPGVAAGDTFALEGCGLSDQVTVRIMQYVAPPTTTTQTTTTVATTTDGCGNLAVEVATASLTSDCGTAKVHFDVPALPDGSYVLWFSHPDGSADDGYYTYYGYGYCHAPGFTVGGAT